MRRFANLTLTLAALALFGVVMTGCDDSPTSVEDFDIQPALNLSGDFNIVLIGGTTSETFDVNYQGLQAHPTAEGTGQLELEKAAENGTAENGSQEWVARFTGSASGVASETVYIRATGSGGEEVVDSLSVNIAPFVVNSSFAAGYATVADYEDPQRSITVSGAAQVDTTTAVASGSNGLSALSVTTTGAGSVTVDRTLSAPDSDRFTFLMLPDGSTDFDLTLTFTELVNGAEVDREYVLPVTSGGTWRQYAIGFDQISPDFDPVAESAGGSGSLVSVTMSTDANVSFTVDELFFANGDNARAEVVDFESTNLAYGPPFCPPTFGDTNDVSASADGPTARTVEGGGCFGYNYQNNGPALFIDATPNTVLSFLARGTEGDQIEIFIQTDGDAGGFGGTVTRDIPVGEWGRIDVPLTELGDDPGALRSAGITNVGFTSAGDSPDFAIDDIKFETRD